MTTTRLSSFFNSSGVANTKKSPTPSQANFLEKNIHDGLLDTKDAQVIVCSDDEAKINPSTRDNIQDRIREETDDLTALYEHFTPKPIEADLFQSLPEMSQIKQGAHGHCHIASALMQIAYNSPTDILQMMKDNKDGTVDVRLFDKDKNPIIYRVEKTDFQPINSRFKFHHGDAWFGILLKAYGFHLIKQEEDLKNKNVVQATVGGMSSDVFLALTGKDAGAYDFDNEICKIGNQKMALIDNKREKLEEIANRINQTQDVNERRLLSKLKYFYYSLEHLDDLTLQSKLSNISINLTEAEEALKACSDQIQNSSFYESCNKDIQTAKEITNIVLSNDVVFDFLKKKQMEGNYITAATNDSFSGGDNVQGHSEKIKDGLVTNHAYAVLGTRERVINGQKRQFVMVANPWQYYAAQSKYDENKKEFVTEVANHSHTEKSLESTASNLHGSNLSQGKPMTAESLQGRTMNYAGVSEIEISTFVKNFIRIDYCPQVNQSSICSNQLYILLQHIITFSGDEETKKMFKACVDVLLDNNKNDVEKIKFVAELLTSKEVQAHFAKSERNILYEDAKAIMQNFIDNTATKDNEAIKNYINNDLLKDLAVLGEQISQSYFPMLNFLNDVKNYWKSVGFSFIKEDFMKILNSNASVPRKMSEIEYLMQECYKLPHHSMRHGDFFEAKLNETENISEKYLEWLDPEAEKLRAAYAQAEKLNEEQSQVDESSHHKQRL